MDVWKKILIIIVIVILLFGAGYGVGYWRSNQVGDNDYQDTIADLERINSELVTGNIQFRTDLERAEGKLRDFLSGTAERNRRASEILGRASGEAETAKNSIDKTIEAIDRLSEAIEILLGSD